VIIGTEGKVDKHNVVRRQNMENAPLIVALETSSRVGSVALARGPSLLAETMFSAALQHSAEILPSIDRLLHRFNYSPDKVAQVHVAIGPGSFTGLRIALTIAKIMHLANATAVVTVDSLDVVAANLGDEASGPPLRDSLETRPSQIAVLLDAKRGEFYAAVYRRTEASGTADQLSPAENAGYEIPAPQRGIWRKIAPDCLITPAELIDRFAGGEPLGLLGDGLLYHCDKFPKDRVRILPERHWSPRASNVHLLGYQKAQAGLFAEPLTLTPFYLRGPQVTLKARY
jgi:tRNA threonylcarbamoyladenosine biosynthesis protein TsaB